MNIIYPPCSGLPVLVVGTTDRPAEVPAKTASFFVHQVEMDAPTLEERKAMIEALGQGTNVARGEGEGLRESKSGRPRWSMFREQCALQDRQTGRQTDRQTVTRRHNYI